MNDSEIIKGLQRMSNEDPDGFSSDVLDLIKRQQAEIERLRSMNQAKLDMIHDVRAELETAKSEAVREFAKILKEYYSQFDDYDHIYACCIIEYIDKLLEERGCNDGK